MNSPSFHSSNSAFSRVSHWGRCKSEAKGGEKPEPRAEQRGFKVVTCVSRRPVAPVIVRDGGRQREKEIIVGHWGVRGRGGRVQRDANKNTTVVPDVLFASHAQQSA